MCSSDLRLGVDRAELGAGGGQPVGRCVAVELEDRPLGPLVEMVDPRPEVLLGQLAGGRVDALGEAADDPLEHRAHEDLADPEPSPGPGQAVPGVSGKEGDRVDHDEAVDPLGEALGEGQGDGAPVVDDEVKPVDSDVVERVVEFLDASP